MLIFWLCLILAVTLTILIIIFYKKFNVAKISLIATTLAIISVFFGLYSYWHDQSIIENNNKVILQNLRIELGQNKHLVSDLNTNCSKYLDSQNNEFTNERYEYFYLDKGLSIISNNSIRKTIMDLEKNLEINNRMMETFSSNFFITSSGFECAQYINLRKELLTNVCKNAEGIEISIGQLLVAKEIS